MKNLWPEHIAILHVIFTGRHHMCVCAGMCPKTPIPFTSNTRRYFVCVVYSLFCLLLAHVVWCLCRHIMIASKRKHTFTNPSMVYILYNTFRIALFIDRKWAVICILRTMPIQTGTSQWCITLRNYLCWLWNIWMDGAKRVGGWCGLQ